MLHFSAEGGTATTQRVNVFRRAKARGGFNPRHAVTEAGYACSVDPKAPKVRSVAGKRVL